MKFSRSWENSVLMFDRRAIPSECFGGHYPWWCEDCGGIEEPSYTMTYRGCGFENFSGPEPEEGENYCPHCGSPETWENESYPPFKSKRYVKRVR